MVLLLLLPALALPADRKPAEPQSWSASALCTQDVVNTPTITCKLQPYEAPHWTARGTFLKSGNQTGWNALNITANTNDAPSDRVAAFAAGFVEGALTPDMMNLEWLNLNLGHVDPKVTAFIEANTKWVASQVQEHAATDDSYWESVGLVYAQYDGLVAGYGADPTKAVLTPLQILLIGMSVELDDIRAAVKPSSRPAYASMREREFHDYVLTHSHCSAMVKVTADLSELFAAHNTWSGYFDALRVWKIYNLPFASSKAHTVSFPGYFARIAGVDDFYVTSQKLTVIETTNSVFNTSLFDAVTPVGTVPYWVRATAANRLAATTPEWHANFYRFNSGTYNNQWMTVDYKLFTPGRSLPDNLFWVSEQVRLALTPPLPCDAPRMCVCMRITFCTHVCPPQGDHSPTYRCTPLRVPLGLSRSLATITPQIRRPLSSAGTGPATTSLSTLTSTSAPAIPRSFVSLARAIRIS